MAKKTRGEPHGDSAKPAKPVRTVTPAPEVQRSDDSDLRIRLGQLAPATLDHEAHSVEAVLGTEAQCLSMDLKTAEVVPGGLSH